MSGISQTVPNYVLGISEQPDQLKTQGQVRDLVNALPDVTAMLAKRPGCTHILEELGANTHEGKWFDIYRDLNEQYIGRIVPGANNGTIQIFRLVDGPVFDYNGTASRAYVNVTAPGTGYTANAQGNRPAEDNFDTDFQDVAVTGPAGTADLTVDLRVDADGVMQASYINTLGTGWESGMTGTVSPEGINSTIVFLEGTAGEECHVNYDDEIVTPFFLQLGQEEFLRAPRADQPNSDYLRGEAEDFKVLTINDTTFIVNRSINTAMAAATEPVYAREGFVRVEQLAFGQVYQFNILQDSGTAAAPSGTITTWEVISAQTPNTSATTEALLDDLVAKVNALDSSSGRFTATKIGDGIYIESRAADPNFSLETPERQLLNVFTDEVQDITLLPDQCENGYRCLVANSGNREDDYYVRFSGANGQSGQGVWEEWRGGGITTTINNATMPHVLVRMSDGSFVVSRGNYDQRLVGDDTTNPQPSFINNPINNVLLFRNRLGFLSRQNVILGRPGDFLNFWVATALAVTPKDPIDISASSTNPATLFDSIEVNTGLMLFSRTEQFMLTTDNDILSAETAKINFVSAYNYNINVTPFTLGTTIGFLNDEGTNTRLYEMANPAREGQPEVVEQSKIISSIYPTGINVVASSKNNAVVLTNSSTSNEIWGYRYFNTTEKRLQAAWFKFAMSGDVVYQCIINDSWYGVIRNNDTTGGNNILTIQVMDLKSNDAVYNVSDVNYSLVVRLDNKTEVAHADTTYDDTTGNTTFDLPWTYDQTKIDGTSTGLKAFTIGDGINEKCVDILTNNANHPNRLNAAFDEVTLDGNWNEQYDLTTTNNEAGTLEDGNFVSEPTVRVSGNGSGMRLSGKVENGRVTQVVISDPGTGYTDGTVVRLTDSANSRFTVNVTDLTVWIGYDYELDVQFPTLYPTRAAGTATKADIAGSLILHRCRFSMGKLGTYEFDVKRRGRPSYQIEEETRYADSYDANDAPILNVDLVTCPIYDRNINTDIHLKSEYPLPVTLISMTWEGEYTNMSYRRA